MKKLSLIVVAVSLIFSSCGVSKFSSANAVGTQTQVVIDSGNFRIIGNVEGHSSATYIFGIGGLSQKSTEENAVANMIKSVKLNANQALTNIYVKTHVASILGIYTRVSYLATGQVIEYIGDTQYEYHQYKNINTSDGIKALPASNDNISVQLFSDNMIHLKAGQTYKLNAILKNINEYNNIEWSSSSDEIATVSNNGTVQAVSPGVIVIVATATRAVDEKKVSDSCMVYVKE